MNETIRFNDKVIILLGSWNRELDEQITIKERDNHRNKC